MQHSRFLVLTGHLNDYPLSDLVGILRHRQKTGRLLIEYSRGPAMFFFNEGELVDAQLDNLNGLQAICVALAQPPASFNFNPLIQPSRRSIENSLQKVVSELLGCWDESGLDIKTIAPVRMEMQPTLPPALSPPSDDGVTPARDRAFVFSPPIPEAPANSHSRPILATAAAVLMMLGLSTVIAVTGGFGKRVSSVPLSYSTPSASEDHAAPQQSTGEPSLILSRNELRNDLKVQRKVAKGNIAISSRQQERTRAIRKNESDSFADSNTDSITAKAPITEEDEKKTDEVTPDMQLVKVILQIESGRVAQASISNPRSGMNAYEALALRIARQRRYPSKAAGQETVVIKVSQPK